MASLVHINSTNVKTFLSELRLDSYYETFVEEGYEEFEYLVNIALEDLLEMGMKKGHARTILRKIKAKCELPKTSGTTYEDKELEGESERTNNFMNIRRQNFIVTKKEVTFKDGGDSVSGDSSSSVETTLLVPTLLVPEKEKREGETKSNDNALIKNTLQGFKIEIAHLLAQRKEENMNDILQEDMELQKLCLEKKQAEIQRDTAARTNDFDAAAIHQFEADSIETKIRTANERMQRPHQLRKEISKNIILLENQRDLLTLEKALNYVQLAKERHEDAIRLKEYEKQISTLVIFSWFTSIRAKKVGIDIGFEFSLSERGNRHTVKVQVVKFQDQDIVCKYPDGRMCYPCGIGKSTVENILKISGSLSVKPGKNSLSKALKEAKNNQINTLLLENGIHDEDGNYVYVNCPINIVGADRDKCVLFGGVMIKGKKKEDVMIKNMTIRGSNWAGIYGSSNGASYQLENLLIDRCGGHGVSVRYTMRNRLKNVEICHSEGSGLWVDGVIVIEGERTSIHHNGTEVNDFGMDSYTATSIININSPLTKAKIATNNGGGGNWGGEGIIEQVSSPEEILARIDKEGMLHVKPGKYSFKKALRFAKKHDVKVLFLQNGIHDEEGNEISINFPIKIIGESRENCILIGGLKIIGSRTEQVEIKNMTIRESKNDGVLGFKGTSFSLDNVFIDKSAYYGVKVMDSKKNIMSNCEISHSGESGLGVYGGIITIDGEHTNIHNNCIKGDTSTFGLESYYRSSSIIQIVQPLTKYKISRHNGGGGNWGGEGKIKTLM